MRSDWVKTGLGEMVEVLDRMRRPVSSAERAKRQGGVPYYGANGRAGWIDQPIFNEELVLLGEDAIDFLNPLAPKAYLISGPSWVNNHAHVLRPIESKARPYFLTEALNMVDYSQFVSFGTRSKLTQNAMMDISVSLPPLVVQDRIVDILFAVDAYIAALQKQEADAQTARNAVLHELLTAGGDNWTETTLGAVAEVVGGGTPTTSNSAYWDGDIVWLTPTEVVAAPGSVLTDSARKITESGLKNSGARLLPEGTVILTSRASVGFSALAGTTLATNQGFQSLIPSPQINNRFLMFWIQNNQQEFHSRAAGSTFKEISKANVRSIILTLPPLSEQKCIVETVTAMDDVVSTTEQAIAHAKLLRSGLLSDLLSGEHEIPATYDRLLGAA